MNLQNYLPKGIRIILKKVYFKKRGIKIFGEFSIATDIRTEEDVSFGSVTINKNCSFGRKSYVNNGFFWENVDVGRYCSIAYNVFIGAPQHPIEKLTSHPINSVEKGFLEKPKPKTIIGNDVWIGANVVVVEGVNISDGAVIGAGAVVVKDVEPYAIVGGVLARLIRHRFSKEVIEDLLKLKWWELPHEEVIKLPFSDVEECISMLKK